MPKETKPKTKPKRGKAKKTKKELTTQEKIDKYLPYLQELQKKLISVVIIFFTAGIIGFLYYQKILGTVMGLFDLQGINIVLTSPYQFFTLAVNTGLITGTVTALPLLIYHLFTFLKPALQEHEYRLIMRLIPASMLLFVLGFGFGVWIVQFVISLYTRTTLEFSIGNLWDISGFFNQILLTGFLLAMIFQLPIAITTLIRFDVIKYEQFVKQRKFFYAGLLIIGALLPPTDIVSLILLTIPPLFLFELAILLNKPND